MTIKIPKSLRGFAYDKVMPVDLNYFDVDLLFSSLFFRIVTDGQAWGRRVNDPTQINEYVALLSRHHDVAGFDSDNGRRLLDRLARSTLIQIGWQGSSRSTQQIEGVNCYSLLAFKAEFPRENSRLRRVDTLIYRMMLDQFRDPGRLRRFFEDVYGEGIVIQRGPEPNGSYDGTTELDTLARLSIALMEGFQPTGFRKTKDRQPREICPAIASHMARDIWRYLEGYQNRIPTEALSHHLKALINFELLIYTLKLFYAVSELVQQPNELPPAMKTVIAPSAPEIYVDFTGSATGLSREMAGACVRQHLEAIAQFIQSNLHLRLLDRYMRGLRGDRKLAEMVSSALADDDGGPLYLQALLRLMDNESIALHVNASARSNEEEIRRETQPLAQEDEVVILSDEIDRVAEGGNSDFERVVLLIVEGQRRKIAHNVVAWYRGVGGLTKPHGILTGHLMSRQSWRYAPSNDLLATLVQLAAVDIPKWDKEDPRPRPVGLGEFLDWLYERFGIVVDRPPEGFAGPDYVAAAKENLRAMLRRLRQMGVFRDLSDDFTVQKLTPPYALSGADEER